MYYPILNRIEKVVRNCHYFVFVSILFSGCASLHNREKALLTGLGGAVLSGTIGYLTTPKDGTSQVGHSALFAGMGGLAGTIGGLFIFDEQKRSSELEKKIADFQKELAECPIQKTLVGEYDVNTGKPLPEHLKNIIQPPKAKEYLIDRWIYEETQAYHCDREVEYEPGSFGIMENKHPQKVTPEKDRKE